MMIRYDVFILSFFFFFFGKHTSFITKEKYRNLHTIYTRVVSCLLTTRLQRDNNDIENFPDFSLSGHIKLGNKKTSV